MSDRRRELAWNILGTVAAAILVGFILYSAWQYVTGAW